jgi:hypothetical protein
VNPQQQKALAATAAVLVGTSILKRSRLARVLVVGAVAAVGYTKLAGHEPEWHDVEAPR